MAYITKTDLAEQSKIPSGRIANLDGGISLGEFFSIQGIEIDSSPSTVQPDYVLQYNGIQNKYQPAPPISSLVGFENRILSGMAISATPSTTCFYINPGTYSTNSIAYDFSGNTFCVSSGHSAYTRYDLVYITGGTGSSSSVITVIEGVSSANPIIPTTPSGGTIISYIKVGLNETESSGMTIIQPSVIYAYNVYYKRGVYNNLSEYLDGNYVNPEIKTFNNDINVLQYGDTATTITFNWETNKKGYQYSLTPTGATYNPNIYSAVFNNINLTGNTGSSSTTYTLVFNDGIFTDTLTTQINFFNKLYYGNFNSSAITTNNDIINLSNNVFITGNTKENFYITGNSEYMYFCYPERFGNLNVFVNGLYSNDFVENTFSFTNPFGFTENYKILRTNYIINVSKLFFEFK